MGLFIICIEDMYFEYCTGSDSPCSEPMTLDEFRGYYLKNEARLAEKELAERLLRVQQKGVSAYDYSCWQDAIICNRAGKNDANLTPDEFVEWVENAKK